MADQYVAYSWAHGIVEEHVFGSKSDCQECCVNANVDADDNEPSDFVEMALVDPDELAKLRHDASALERVRVWAEKTWEAVPDNLLRLNGPDYYRDTRTAKLIGELRWTVIGDRR